MHAIFGEREKRYSETWKANKEGDTCREGRREERAREYKTTDEKEERVRREKSERS